MLQANAPVPKPLPLSFPRSHIRILKTLAHHLSQVRGLDESVLGALSRVKTMQAEQGNAQAITTGLSILGRSAMIVLRGLPSPLIMAAFSPGGAYDEAMEADILTGLDLARQQQRGANTAIPIIVCA